jgi:hypothetical protein
MLPCHASVIAFVACIYCFFPLFSPVNPETDASAKYDYAPDDQTLSAELPGKQNPLDHSNITYSFSPMLALEFAIVIACSYSDA